MYRVALLTCLLGISALALGACAYNPGPYASSYQPYQSGYAPNGPSSYGPYDEANPLELHGNYD
jgi:hypothetical protein